MRNKQEDIGPLDSKGHQSELEIQICKVIKQMRNKQEDIGPLDSKGHPSDHYLPQSYAFYLRLLLMVLTTAIDSIYTGDHSIMLYLMYSAFTYYAWLLLSLIASLLFGFFTYNMIGGVFIDSHRFSKSLLYLIAFIGVIPSLLCVWTANVSALLTLEKASLVNPRVATMVRNCPLRKWTTQKAVIDNIEPQDV